MRSILFALSVLFLVGCFPKLPEDKAITRFVFDRDDLLTDAEEASLDSLLSAYEKRTTNEIVLFTSSDTSSTDSAFLKSMHHLDDSLGIGKRFKENGMLIGFNKHLLELYTMSQKGIVPDTLLSIAISDSVIIPRLNEGKYFGSFLAGAHAFMDLADSTTARKKRIREARHPKND